MASGLQSLEVISRTKGLLSEVIVVRVVALSDNLAARLLTNDPVHIFSDSVKDPKIGPVVGNQTPKVSHVYDGQIATDVPGVYLAEVQGAVLHQP